MTHTPTYIHTHTHIWLVHFPLFANSSMLILLIVWSSVFSWGRPHPHAALPMEWQEDIFYWSRCYHGYGYCCCETNPSVQHIMWAHVIWPCDWWCNVDGINNFAANVSLAGLSLSDCLKQTKCSSPNRFTHCIPADRVGYSNSYLAGTDSLRILE